MAHFFFVLPVEGVIYFYLSHKVYLKDKVEKNYT